MAAGTVARIFTDSRGGLTVVVDHGAGVVTACRHLSSVEASVGRRVGRGEVIGLSGTSGIVRWSGGIVPPHIHVTLFVDGIPTDPYRCAAVPTDRSYWVNQNHPRSPLRNDDVWDHLDTPSLLDRGRLFEQAAAQNPVAWRNFHRYCRRVLPMRLSYSGDSEVGPCLTLPFYDEPC
jgi:murein DD-endopeptidase MepM/ murein hydrolase activator NlpD